MAGDYIISPKVYNEFSPGNTGSNSWRHAARSSSAFNIPFMLEGTYERWQYPHNCNGLIPASTTRVRAEVLRHDHRRRSQYPGAYHHPPVDQDVDVRLAVRVLQPAHLHRRRVTSGSRTTTATRTSTALDSAARSCPDLNHAFSFFGSVWYYPTVNGTDTNFGRFNRRARRRFGARLQHPEVSSSA